ncbi:MAG: integron integrase, partial [Candidatus Electrothrix sp. AR3]|nr:integron integrase [Candidatus Electrothrix sp. AR3]
MSIQNRKSKRIMEQVHETMRLHHYSIHTERSYCGWITRFIKFHDMQSRDDLNNGESQIEAFLTHLAINEQVAPATQNQAMNALVFLYKKVLQLPLEQKIDAVRAKNSRNIPVVMTSEEVAAVISRMQGVAQLVVKLLYGSGLRISEAIRLRMHDIRADFSPKHHTHPT